MIESGEGVKSQRPPVLIAARHLSKTFRHRGTGEPVVALDDVSLSVRRGESLALVGESGSGKTTLGRCLMRLIDPSSGTIEWQGSDITGASGRALRRFRSKVQMVFQDPYDALDPRMTIQSALEEPLEIQKVPRREAIARVRELLQLVRLGTSYLSRYPHQLSGGQQQRVGIARAIATEPDLLILDEPTSALDWLVRGEIHELLIDLRRRLHLTYILISHDLSAVQRVTDRAVVMYLGRLVEEATTEFVFRSPTHPYTKALLSAALPLSIGRQQRRLRLAGQPPVSRPSGCPLHPRCPISVPACRIQPQQLVEVTPGHRVACMRVSGAEAIDWPEGWSNGGAGTITRGSDASLARDQRPAPLGGNE